MNIRIMLLLLFTASATYISCKKTGTTNPVADKLAGNWKNTYFISDTDGNHIMDSHDAMDTINSTYVTQFTANGNGAILSGSTSIASFTWKLLNNNTYLQTTITGSGTTIQHIDSLSATTLILRDTTGISYTWQVFKKQ